MGLDLTMIPVEHESERLSFGRSLLQLDRDHELFERIASVDSRPAPDSFTCFRGSYEGENGYGIVEKDPYGNELRAVRVDDLLEAWPLGRCMTSRRNGATRAYLARLDRRSWVVLYWH